MLVMHIQIEKIGISYFHEGSLNFLLNTEEPFDSIASRLANDPSFGKESS